MDQTADNPGGNDHIDNDTAGVGEPVAELDTVRCQRVEVVDQKGVTRIVLNADRSGASLRIAFRSAPGRTTGIETYAIEDPDGGTQPLIGIGRLDSGDGTELVSFEPSDREA